MDSERKPKVWNKHHKNYPKEAVYIGRGSPWGNPFVIDNYSMTRERAIDCYREWLLMQPQLVERVKKELVGQDLVCFCAPKACHGDILLRIANEKQEKQHEENKK